MFLVTALIIAALLAIFQAFLLYMTITNALGEKPKRAIVFVIIKIIVYGIMAWIMTISPKAYYLGEAVSFGISFFAFMIGMIIFLEKKKQ